MCTQVTGKCYCAGSLYVQHLERGERATTSVLCGFALFFVFSQAGFNRGKQQGVTTFAW